MAKKTNVLYLGKLSYHLGTLKHKRHKQKSDHSKNDKNNQNFPDKFYNIFFLHMISYFVQELNEDEELIKIIRKHWIILALPFLKALLIIVTAFLLSHWLLFYEWGVVIFFVWLLIGLVYWFYKWLVWYLDCFIVTNQRIIDIHQKGLFNRIVAEANLNNIQDVIYQIQGIIATFLNFGEVRIQLSGNSGVIVMEQIKDPQKVRELIVELQETEVMNQEIKKSGD